MSGNEVVIHVKAEDDSAPVMAKTKENLKGVGDEAGKTKEKVKGLGDETAHLGQETGKVQSEIKRLTAEIRELNHEMDRTGDTELWSKISSKQGELARFKKVAKDFAQELKEQAEQAAHDSGPQMTKVLTASMDLTGVGFKGPLIGALVAAAVAAAPGISAMVGGAVIGAVGLGGIVGGIVAAAHDPRVKAAGTDFAQGAFGAMKDEIGPAFVEPTVGALGILKSAVRDLFSENQLGPAMRELSKLVEPLAAGFAGLLREMVPGLNAAFKAALPVLKAFADALPQLGKDLSHMFKSMSDDPDAAIMGMKMLMDVIGDVAIAFGDIIGFLGDVYVHAVKLDIAMLTAIGHVLEYAQILAPILGPVGKHLDDLRQGFEGDIAAMEAAKSSTDGLSGGMSTLGSETAKAREELDALAHAIDDIFNRQMNLDEATSRWHKGLIDLRKELTEGTRTLSLNSEEGLKNRDKMLDLIETANRMRDAYSKQTNDVAGANVAYQKNIESLYDMGRQAGFTKAELDKLFGPYLSGNAVATLSFQFPGLVEGLDAVSALNRIAGAGQAAGEQAASWGSLRNAERHAAGGPWGGGWGTMNEQGAEAVRLPNGSTVIPAGQTQQMMAGGGGSSQPVVVQLMLPNGTVWRQVLIDDALTRGVASDDVAAAYP